MEKNSKKGLYITIIILMLIVIFLGAVVTTYLVMNGTKKGTAPKNPILSQEMISRSDVRLAKDSVPGIYETNMKQVEIKGVGTKASVIDSLKKNNDSLLSQTKQKTDGNGCIYYLIDNKPVRIDIPMGINMFQYNRSYYFNNGILYYAHIYNGGADNGLYFHNGTMFRYNNEGNKILNNEFKNKGYLTVGNFALNEGYAFYDYYTGKTSER